MTAEQDFMVYTVGKQDTLSDILRRFNISITDLKEYNTEKDLFSLREGQTLLIKNTQGDLKNTYTLGENENLLSVAKKFNVSTLKVLKANPNYMPQEIKPGIIIALPDYQN